MKKITIAFLISCGFLSAQTKTVLTPYGEKVDINTGVSNGLHATLGYLQLGGTLTQTTTITTAGGFTFGIKGLTQGYASDNVLVQDPNSGVLRYVDPSQFSPYLWSLKGNEATDPTTDFIGNIDERDLLFKTDSKERIRIIGNSGLIGINNANPQAALDIKTTDPSTNPLRLNNLQAGQTSEKVLTVDNNGIVHKALSFSKGIVQCNETGELTINDPNITATSVVLMNYYNPTSNPGNSVLMEIGTRIPGVSFTITTLQTTEYYVQYLIIN